MRKIRVLHLAEDYFPRISGVVSRIDDWCRMTSDVFDNYIIYPFYEQIFNKIGPSYIEKEYAKIYRFDFYNGYEDVDDIVEKYAGFLKGAAKYESEKICNKFGLKSDRILSRHINHEMIEFIKNLDFDVMIGYSSTLISLLPPFVRKDVPFILNQQYDVEFGNEGWFTNEVKDRINAMFLFHKFMVERQLKQDVSFPVYYVPQQVNANLFKPIIPVEKRDRYNLLFVGRVDLSFWEITDRFVCDVLCKLPDKYHFTMVGRENIHALKRIYELASERGIRHRVHHIGVKYDPVEINDVYNKYVFAIRPTTGESYGRFAMESMSAGCTFIGVNHWCYDWAPDKYMHKIGGGKVDPKHPERTNVVYDDEYVEKLQAILDGYMVLNGRELILKQNDWKAVKQKYVDIVMNTIETSR